MRLCPEPTFRPADDPGTYHNTHDCYRYHFMPLDLLISSGKRDRCHRRPWLHLPDFLALTLFNILPHL